MLEAGDCDSVTFVCAIPSRKAVSPTKSATWGSEYGRAGKKDYEHCWSNGCIQLDKVGITSMRLPEERSLSAQPMVVQAEVRLATKEQDCAVVIVIWSTNEKSNPLYLLRNLTSRTILCRQPLQEETEDLKQAAGSLLPMEPCAGEDISTSDSRELCRNPVFECGSEVGPIVRHFLGLDRIDEFVWILRKQKVACFGFDDPEKPHILEWAFVDEDDRDFDNQPKKGFVEGEPWALPVRLFLQMERRLGVILLLNIRLRSLSFLNPTWMPRHLIGLYHWGLT
jgi:hypothetical protein